MQARKNAGTEKQTYLKLLILQAKHRHCGHILPAVSKYVPAIVANAAQIMQ